MTKKVIYHDSNDNEFEIEANKLIFHLSVCGVLIKQDKILLSKQWDGYDSSGSGIGIHETIEEVLDGFEKVTEEIIKKEEGMENIGIFPCGNILSFFSARFFNKIPFKTYKTIKIPDLAVLD